MQHSQEFRNKVIGAVLEGSGTQGSLAKEFGVGRSTIQYWMRQHRQSGASTLANQDKRPQEWTGEQRLEALVVTHGLSDSELGRWCRERGVHTHHLVKWRRELAQATASGQSASKAESRALRQENRALRKELRRKDKALAETTALLVLKKKATAIWGELEDD